MFLQVTKLTPIKSLLKYLKKPTLKLNFPLSKLYNFTQQIYNKINYLKNKRLIHKNLTTKNILMFNKHKVSNTISINNKIK